MQTDHAARRASLIGAAGAALRTVSTGAVLARVETVAPGDRIFTPRGDRGGYVVDELAGPYDDETFVVVYRRLTYAWENRAGAKMVASYSGEQLCSLAPLVRGERLIVVRGSGEL